MARNWLLLLLLLISGAASASPEVQSWITSKGARVMYVQTGGLPMVDVRVVFDAGGARDADLPGTAVFTNALLSEGAGAWDAQQIALRLDNRGIELGSGALRDMAWVSFRSLSENDTLAVALETLSAVLAEPRMEPEAIERIRQQMQAGVRQDEQNPGKVAQRLFYRQVYGAHPYAHDPDGTRDSLQRITAADLRRFHQRYYVAANAVIAIVGDLERSRAEAIAEQLTAGLAQGEHAPLLPSPAVTDGGELRQAFPSTQSHIYIGQPGMVRLDPDYFALYVGNHVLGGGGLVSILGEEVRNKRGLSYSVYSYFSPMRAAGPFLMGAQTKNSQVETARQVMLDTLRRFIEQGPGEKELDEAKQNIMGGFPLQVASNKQIVEYIAMMGFYGYPLDWLDTLVGKVAAVSAAQVQDAFRRRVDPQRLTTVVVGGE